MNKRSMMASLSLLFTACSPEPELHLFEAEPTSTKIVFAELELDAYWDYEVEVGIRYEWRTEWYYGWDAEDYRIWGEIGYVIPNTFNIRRYFTGSTPYAHHTKVISNTIEGNTFQGEFNYGFWDMLVFNDIKLKDGVQSLNFDETTTLDSITVYTNQSMAKARYNAPRYSHAFYEPEELFSAYEQAIEIDREHKGFEYDPERNLWVKRLNMVLQPITYIYLTQVIVHHNNGKIVGVEGTGTLSGFARSSVLNSGRGGEDPVSVTYQTRWKKDCDMNGEKVDIAGGRLLNFGLCGHACGRLHSKQEVHDTEKHYMDVKLLFNNGIDSTFVFDVTQQVRDRYKGGVLTVELDMDTISVPSRSGGSGFDAVVKEFEEETHEIEM
jgi:hypothetical protein